MDTKAVKMILHDMNSNYDIKDVEDITQLVLDLLETFNKNELEDAILQINILKESE